MMCYAPPANLSHLDVNVHGKAHSTYAALQLSAHNGCHLCSLMLSCLKAKYSTPQHLDPEILKFKTFINFQDAEISLSVDTPEGPAGHIYNQFKGVLLLSPVVLNIFEFETCRIG